MMYTLQLWATYAWDDAGTFATLESANDYAKRRSFNNWRVIDESGVQYYATLDQMPPPPDTAADAGEERGQPIFEYEGNAYVRPMGRGIILEDGEKEGRYEGEDLADLLCDELRKKGGRGDGDVKLRIVVHLRARALEAGE